MIALTLDEVAAAVGGRIDLPPAGPDGERRSRGQRPVTAVGTDSRVLPPGALFVALPGQDTDGHDFVADAVGAGATAVLVSRPVDVAVPRIVVGDTWAALASLAAEVRRRVAPVAVAITGSVGKTTVKDLTAAAVGAGRRTHAARGSFNNELGVPLTLLGLSADTQVLVAEVAARHVGDIAALAPLVAPDVAIVTAVAPVHLEVFGSIDAVARAKAELVGSLGPGGTAVLNTADPRVAAMARLAPAVVRVAMDEPTADVTASEVRLDRFARARATAHTPWGRTELVLPVAGRHQVTNALLALATAGHLGVDVGAAAAAIAAAPVSPWRGEVVDAGGVVVLNDAYNSSPAALAAALETLTSIERTGRCVAVLGTMAEIGPTADAEHERLGTLAAELGVDRLVVVGSDAAGFARGARRAGHRDVHEVRNAPGALDLLVGSIAPGDVVLVKASRVARLEVVATGLVQGRRDARTGSAPVTGAGR